MSHDDKALWHVCIPDWHLPFHDATATEVTLQALRVLRPALHGVTLLGDTIDASSWSSHPRRSRVEVPADHQVEVDALDTILRAVIVAAGRRAVRAWCEGNHEARVERELMRFGRPDLVDLLSPTRVVERLGFTVAPYARAPQQHVIWTARTGRRAIACHGAAEGTHATRNHARIPCWRGDLVVHGHTHRLAHHVEHDVERNLRLEAISPGFLGRLDPPWMAPRAPNWQHGIAVLRLSAARIDGWPCQIVNGCLTLPDGREVRA